MYINKPTDIETYDLIAVMGLRESPVKPQNPMNMSYSKSTLAVNIFDSLIQVYISSNTKKGINDFKSDYPNAEIQENPMLDEEKWRLLAFPMEASENSNTLDVYFKGRHKNLNEKIEQKKIKEEAKRK